MKHLGFASVPAVLQYIRYAESQGIDTKEAISEAGIEPAVLKKENGRIKGEQFQSLINALIRETNDPLMGLNSSQHVQPGSYSVLGYILMSCATIGEAIDRITPFERLVGDMGVTTVELKAGQIFVTWHCAYPDPIVRQHMIDNVLASWTRYAHWLANQNTPPTKIQLVRSQPARHIARQYEQFFGCHVQFEAEQNTIVASQDILSLPLRQPDKLLLKTLEDHASNRMSILDEDELRFSIRVSNAIRSQLAMGVTRKDLVAEALGMTARTLQRKLLNEGSSYQQLLDNIRLEQASMLLTNSQLAIQDIAINLGFSDSRSFHRSFKNRTGLTPGDYRSQQASKKQKY